MTREAAPAGSKADYRFEVAISFAGDNKRELVRAVAELLRKKIGDGKVFFHEWFESEIAGHDAHLVLHDIYGKKTRLVVACVCKRYSEKPWTQDEWRAIQAFERNLRDAGTNNVNRINPLPGQAEFLDLVRAVIELAARDNSKSQLGWVDEIARYALKKHPEMQHDGQLRQPG